MDTQNVYPVQAAKYELKKDLVTLKFKDPNPSFLDRWFFKNKPAKEIKVDLDDIGSFVWLLCNGDNKVADIIAQVSDKFGEKVEPADKRVNLFLQQMVQNKFLKLYEKR